MELGPLGGINLITGKNDTGKTSILEALWLLLEGKHWGDLPNQFRAGAGSGNHNETFWSWLVLNKDKVNPARIECQNGGDTHTLLVIPAGGAANPHGLNELHKKTTVGFGPLTFQWAVSNAKAIALPKVSLFSSRPTDPNKAALDYNRVILRKGKSKVEKMLRHIDPRVESIEALQSDRDTGALLYADIGLAEMIPVTHMGQGFNRILQIYSEIVANESTILLIDEIENGLHHSVLEIIWAGLLTAVDELGIQIFATTHSWECITAAHRAATQAHSEQFRLFRMDRVNEGLRATLIDNSTIETAQELHWEMR